MKKIKLLTGLVALSALVGSLTGCGETATDTVRLGLHLNFGAGAGYSAINQGFFEEEGVTIDAQTGEGPALAAALVAGQIDVSFMGNGVAWNYFTDKQEIKLVALDNLTNDDKLIASNTGKGKGLTAESPTEDLVEALKGATVAFDQNATPLTFWTNLLNTLNADLADSEKLWWTDLEGNNLPEGLSTYDEANKVNVSQASNANVGVAMQNGEYDFCVAFAPVSTTLIEDSANFTMVASTLTHFPETYTPSTWAVNASWLETHEETFEKFMRGLVKGMNFRRDNPEESEKDVEVVTAGTYTATGAVDIAQWLGAKEQLEILNDGRAMQYVENIRASQTSAEMSDSVTAEMATDFSYLKEACEALA